jgi:DNA-binding CsgD family transcriptional regulator
MDALQELEKIADLSERIDYAYDDAAIGTAVLEPLASYLGADSASFRSLAVAERVPKVCKVVTIEIPESVNDAYKTRYHAFDPARRLLQRRIAEPLFSDSVRGEWSRSGGLPRQEETAATVQHHREEFARYHAEFLLPSGFFHHLGFCFRDLEERTILFDFHRRATSAAFGALEVARNHIVANVIQGKASQYRRIVTFAKPSEVDSRLSPREFEVAEAVARGLSNKEVANNLDISVRTVENHMRSIFAKLCVSTRTRLTVKLRDTYGRGLAQQAPPTRPD